MRVLVCGGRKYNNEVEMFTHLNWIDAHVGEIEHIIHGGASGADKLAGELARDLGIPVTVYPADWDKYDLAAGPIRNYQMIREGKPDVVVAFPGGRGTRDMIRQARANHIRTFTWSDIQQLMDDEGDQAVPNIFDIFEDQ